MASGKGEFWVVLQRAKASAVRVASQSRYPKYPDRHPTSVWVAGGRAHNTVPNGWISIPFDCREVMDLFGPPAPLFTNL